MDKTNSIVVEQAPLLGMLKGSQLAVDKLLRIPGSYITGSFAVGGERAASDVDIVIPLDVDVGPLVDDIAKTLYYSKVPSDYNKGFKLLRQGRGVPINILQLHPLDYCAWLFATNTMASQAPIKDKNLRHRSFEAFVLAFKMSNISGLEYTIDGAYNYFEAHKPALTFTDIIKIQETKEGGQH
jgi:hypothetical protein